MSDGAARKERDFLSQVLAYVAGHLGEPMTVAELASVAGFSPHHFSRLFTARFGTSVMGYVRDMRLDAAAQRLTGASPPTLIELAFDCGFESQEAFTRAFRRRHGVPPGQYRRAAPQSPSMETGPMTATSSAARPPVEMLKDRVRREAFTVAGVRARFDHENKHGIPMLWPRLIRCLPLPGQAGAGTYGVCAMADAEKGVLSYMAGVEIEGDAALPDGFERQALAAQSYAVFRIIVDGSDLHSQMQAAMPEIWGRLLPQAGLKTVAAPDFEYYPPGFEPNRKGAHVDIYVPVEG